LSTNTNLDRLGTARRALINYLVAKNLAVRVQENKIETQLLIAGPVGPRPCPELFATSAVVTQLKHGDGAPACLEGERLFELFIMQ
jgi:hypothetical protein